MGAMRTQNPRITLKVHMLIHNVPEYVSRTTSPLGPASEQALESQHRFFDIFYHRFKLNCTNYPVFRERLLSAVLHYNACHLYSRLTFCTLSSVFYMLRTTGRA